jgi:hypothetical protein
VSDEEPPATPLAGEERIDVDQHERRYDSFHLRIWTQPGSEDLLRVEIHHLQTNLVEIATAVSVGWLLETILACLAGESSSTSART